MSLDLCRLSLQQIKELLRLTESTLQEICCKRFSGEELYLKALSQILGGKGRRGPASIFIVFREPDGAVCRGKLFHLVAGTLIEKAEMDIDPTSGYAASLFAGRSAERLAGFQLGGQL